MLRSERQAAAMLFVAVALPLLLFGALQQANSYRFQKARVEATAMARAREINARVDGRLLADQSALEVLSHSHFLRLHDWRNAERRIREAQATRPDWKNVILTDLATGAMIWQTADPAATPAGTSTPPWIRSRLGPDASTPAISGIVGKAPICPCIALHQPVMEHGAARYLLSVARGADDLQAIVMEKADARAVTALVDGQGLFIARSKDPIRKFGTPATRYVRNAIAAGDAGVYRGVTYEGLHNYTTFETSRLTGWSTHVAIDDRLLSDPTRNSLVLTVIAGLTAVGLGVVIAAFALRTFRVRQREVARNAQAQKLAAVGQLASGIAHDFNNLLMVISGNLDRMADHKDSAPFGRQISGARTAAEKGRTLIQQLLAFTRSEPMIIGKVDVAALLGALRGLLEQSVGPSVVLQIVITTDCGLITSNAGQLELALVNLAVNARDAMPGGGTLSIRVYEAQDDPDYVAVEVTDTGEGMPRNVMDRAMEPFFTTKPLGRGTGLGLAQVFGIVSQSGGTVEIASRPGDGTVITLRLPRWREPTPLGAKAPND